MSRFIKSSYSSVVENCVEIALSPGDIAIRDSKNPNRPTLHFTSPAYRAFSDALLQGALRTADKSPQPPILLSAFTARTAATSRVTQYYSC